MCGLKLFAVCLHPRLHGVTSFTDVWIEILLDVGSHATPESHPSRMCGLKFYFLGHSFPCKWVTSFTDVWIEIAVSLLRRTCGFRHILHGCVD